MVGCVMTAVGQPAEHRHVDGRGSNSHPVQLAPTDIHREVGLRGARGRRQCSGRCSKGPVSLGGARIVSEATKDLKPDEGHMHLIMDDKLQSMTFSLQDQIQAEPGTHLLLAEFVAGDHAPFNPRVLVTRTFVVPPP